MFRGACFIRKLNGIRAEGVGWILSSPKIDWAWRIFSFFFFFYFPLAHSTKVRKCFQANTRAEVQYFLTFDGPFFSKRKREKKETDEMSLKVWSIEQRALYSRWRFYFYLRLSVTVLARHGISCVSKQSLFKGNARCVQSFKTLQTTRERRVNAWWHGLKKRNNKKGKEMEGNEGRVNINPARIEMYSLFCRYMYSRRWFHAVRKYLSELLYCNWW